MNRLYSKVYGWLFAGLLLTFATGAFLSNYENAVINMMSGASYLFIVLIEFGVAIFLSARIHKMNSGVATFCYLLYSFITGITFSTLFMVLITSLVFGLFAILGMFTKISLDKLGTTLFMILLGMIIATIINIFLGNSTLDLIISIIGVIVFVAYIGYDVKKLPIFVDNFGEENGAIYGAFQLYLDFINIFIYLLNIFGKNDN